MKSTAAYLSYIVHSIHTAVVASVDESGFAVTCAIDMMDCDADSLYFLTARGKSFYDRLKRQESIAFTALKGADTMHSVAVSVRGKAREIGPQRLEDLFEKNPYMKEIYPSRESRAALTVFQIYEGTGEWFDLSVHPIERAAFSFGGASEHKEGYYVTDRCIGCRLCYSRCPQKSIDIRSIPVVIQQEHCIRCGNCMEICPEQAVERR
jgi:NAD-dependent dihydropyrimidine dehydrogenase PreA subunit/uncharacterized pyridoxamine 5'-phosphate oxidase family protein